MSDTTTRGVRIQVRPQYVPEQSDAGNSQYLFAYHVRITNLGEDTVQLLSRHWVITNGQGKTEEVRGPGVVGYQPTLKSGETFEYTSACPLTTPVGTMHGEFNMVIPATGEKFDAGIAPFRLAVPRALN
ncbi:MAG: Co2+/Mg2+ efflux protein ApaG [Gammaproteobacteria bacterium]|nr:Co2+/Mg2+ efflux protein ApaG [Gammaproteobacteria bacterium]MBI3171140.1 Co2+/Mg2+ efflux protein ApaG [Hydrocarboniphaga effusa]